MRSFLHSALAATFSLSLAACLPNGCGSQGRRLATFSLGGQSIEVTEKDIAYLNARYECQGAPAPADSLFAGYIVPVLRALLARNLGLAPSPEEIDAEIARINRETREPGTLECIKKKFGEDTEAYRRVFISPYLVERKLEAARKKAPDGQTDLQDWIRLRVEGATLRFDDARLLEHLKKTFPTAWWAKLLP